MKKEFTKSFINAGTIVIADMLVTHLKTKTDFLDFIRMISGGTTIDFNLK
jgi:glutaminase